MKQLVIRFVNGEDMKFEEHQLIGTTCDGLLAQFNSLLNLSNNHVLYFESTREDALMGYNYKVTSIRYKVFNSFNINNIIGIQILEVMDDE